MVKLLASLLGLAGLCIAAGSAEDQIVSGDHIFLWSHTNSSIDVDDTWVARARWQLRGTWQALEIEKPCDGGAGCKIRSGDMVYIRAHTGSCLQLLPGVETVGTALDRCPAWRIEAVSSGSDYIKAGESIYLKLPDESKFMDIEGTEDGLVRARWDLTGSWQTLRIERESPDAVMAGDHIYLAAPSGARLDVQGTEIRARWHSIGVWRALVLEANENLGPWMQSFALTGGDGRAIYSGDTVTLWTDNGNLVDVEQQLAQARFGEAGVWQKFVIEKAGGGAIRRGDAVFLKAHTGMYLEIRGERVEATGEARSSMGALVIGQMPASDKTVYKQYAILGVVAFGTVAILVYELAQPRVSAPTGGAPRLESLDALRWIGSAQIVASHFYGFAWGSAWTQFFFVLSGFVLAYIEMARPAGTGQQLSQLRYVLHRMVTLYPTYICVLVVSAIQWRHSALDWMTLPLHLMFMQAWFPITYLKLGSTEWQWSGLQWVQVSWFVSALFIYWLCLRPLARRIRHMSLQLCTVLVFSLWACSGIWYFLGDVLLKEKMGCREATQRCYTLFNDYFMYHSICGMCHVFVAGVVMARIFILTSMYDADDGGRPRPDSQRLVLDPKRAPVIFRYGASLGYLVYGLLVLVVGSDGYNRHVLFFHNGGIMPAMLLLLVGGAAGHDPLVRFIFQNRVFKLLGRISYAQYLSQYNVYYFVKRIFPEQDGLVHPKIVFPFALFVLSFLLERLVTRVGTEWLKPGKGRKRDSSIGRAVAWLETAQLTCCTKTWQPEEVSARAASTSPDVEAAAPRTDGQVASAPCEEAAAAELSQHPRLLTSSAPQDEASPAITLKATA